MAAASLLVLSAGLGVPAEPFRLVMPVVYGTHLPGLAELAAQLAKLVDQLSGGTLELDLKQPGDGTQPQEILDKVSHGSIDAGFAFGGAETSGWFAKEVRRPEDIKGLRMRGFGLGRVISRLGATTVLVPGGSLGNAFDKHEIDAAAFLTAAVDQRQRVQDHGTY